MRFSCFFFSIAVFANCMAYGTEKTTYPYDAIVDKEDGENVWSGPDFKKHYPTSLLNRGDRVKVLRADPGGWCMIEPPKGSHGWVRADLIDQDGANGGFVNSNRVRVHVGSDVKPEKFLTYQAELSKGDAVEILGEKTFTFDDGPKRMLKISPVAKREWRWIKRRSIVPLDGYKPTPFPTELQTVKSRHEPVKNIGREVQQASLADSDVIDSTEPTPTDHNVSKSERTGVNQPGKQRLTEIDVEFRDMIKNDKDVWDLDSIENQYVQLDDDIGTPWMTAEVTRRLDAVKRYRKSYDEYAEFVKITAAAKQRDAQLVAIQSHYQSIGFPQARMVPSAKIKEASVVVQARSTDSSTATKPAFDGAGVVKKLSQSFPGGPQYVLITPEGKALTFLQPSPGIDLDRYDGRSMGIIGQRVRRDDWSSDVITVRSLQPVQLSGSGDR